MKLLTIIMYHDIVNQNDDIYDKFNMLFFKNFLFCFFPTIYHNITILMI